MHQYIKDYVSDNTYCFVICVFLFKKDLNACKCPKIQAICVAGTVLDI